MYEANQSFSGIITMSLGEVREIKDEDLAKDLLKAKLIKKYVISNTKQLQNELKEATEKITELQTIIDEKTQTIEQFQTQSNSSELEKIQNNEDETEGSHDNKSE